MSRKERRRARKSDDKAAQRFAAVARLAHSLGLGDGSKLLETESGKRELMPLIKRLVAAWDKPFIRDMPSALARKYSAPYAEAWTAAKAAVDRLRATQER